MMSKHTHTAFTPTDFVLVRGVNGDEAFTFAGEDSLIGQRGTAFAFDQFENPRVFYCSPIDRICDDITELMAQAWWNMHGEDDHVPAVFRPFLEDEIDSLRIPSERGITYNARAWA